MKNQLIKKIGVLTLVAVMALGSVACGNETAGTDVTVESVSSEAPVSSEASVESSEEVQTEEVENNDTEESVTESVEKEELVIADNAVDYVKNMKLGWNLGNTLDATNGSGLSSETSWGMPKVTKEQLQYVKEVGFTSIRIPVSWHNHMKDGVIDAEWMDRVQEVVDWAIEADLYVIINSHHDNPEYYPSPDKLDHAKEFMVNVWTQVSERFKDYDEQLIFAAMNEPRLEGTDIEWWFANDDAKGIECIKCVNELNQVFIDTVRKGGGYNESRFLMVSCAIGAPQNALNDNFVLPTDTIENHLMLDVHAYTPYDFAMNGNGYDKWSSDKSSEFSFMNELKTKFADQGCGVVIGEFGATNKDNIKDRCNWATTYCARAHSLGIACFLWDNGQTKVGEENFGMIDRSNLEVYYPELLKAMLDKLN